MAREKLSIKQSEKVLQYAADMPLAMNDSGRLFVGVIAGDRKDFYPLDSPQAFQSIMFESQNWVGCIPAESSVREGIKMVPAFLRKTAKTVRQGIRPRIAEDGEDYVYDHADKGGNCTRWNAGGWTFGPDISVPFIRSHASPTPEPIRPASLEEAFEIIDEFHDLLRIPEESRLPRLAAQIEDLKPDTPFVIRHNIGPAGSGKTWAAAGEIRLLEPFAGTSPAQVMPDIENIAAAAQHQHAIFFDNIKRIEDGLSNQLCCVALGSPFIWRTMYERAGVTMLTMHAPIQMTGIHYHLASDLADRSLVTEFPVREDYLPMSEVLTEFDANHGRFLGALFTLAVESLRRI